MKRQNVTNLLIIVLFAFGVVMTGISATAKDSSPPRTLEEITASTEVVTRTDGITETRRAFSAPVTWEEYLAALAAATDGASTVAVNGGGSPPQTPGSPGGCVPPDDDYDGDGFVGLDDSFPALQGEYIADRPGLTTNWSYIEAGVELRDPASPTSWFQATTFHREDLEEMELAKDASEIRRAFNSPIALRLNFGLADRRPSFQADLEPGTLWEIAEVSAPRWAPDLAHEIRSVYGQIQAEIANGTLTLDPGSGSVSGLVDVTNSSQSNISMLVEDLRIAIVGQDPFLGQKMLFGEAVFSGPYMLPPGASLSEMVELDGLNGLGVIQALAEAWILDFELAGFDATDVATGESIFPTLETIGLRTAASSVHFGDGSDRPVSRISVYQPGDACLTPMALLETSLGSENVEFDRMGDDTLVVKRIGHRANGYADRNFDDLTEAEQEAYGRWVAVFDFADGSSPAELDLEETFLVPGDAVFFYYLTADDYVAAGSSPSDSAQFNVANDGTAPAEQTALGTVLPGNAIELQVETDFEIYESYTEYMDDIYNSTCGFVYNATYHGRRIAVDSQSDDYPVSDPDFFGMSLRFGDTDWIDIETLLGEPSANAELLSLNGYPDYDYALRFVASPELLDGQSIADLQVRDAKPQQSFYIGFTGWNIRGAVVDCRWWVDDGFFENTGTALMWPAPYATDDDRDGFFATTDGGIDFDDSNDRRFPFAPEHLDFVDNDGDADVDEEPLLCPTAVVSGDFGTCVLDDRMNWYGDSPNIGMGYRWHYIDGSTGSWIDLGSVTDYEFLMPDQPAIAGIEVEAVNYAVTGSPSGSNYVERIVLVSDADSDGWTTYAGDCDDNNADTYPGAPEICDGLDNNCDGEVPADEFDGDWDGYPLCNDCNDANSAVHPDRAEDCTTSWDDNCDGYINEGCGGGSPIFRKPNPVMQDEGDDGGW